MKEYSINCYESSKIQAKKSTFQIILSQLNSGLYAMVSVNFIYPRPLLK